MKNYNKLSSKYEKKNRFANISLKSSRKPILIVLISIMVICICSLLIIQVSKIEKAQRNNTIVAVQGYTTSEQVELQNSLGETIDLIVFSPIQKNTLIDQILLIEGYGIEREDFVPGTQTVIFKYTILFYDDIGNLIYKHYGKEEIDFVIEKSKELNLL